MALVVKRRNAEAKAVRIEHPTKNAPSTILPSLLKACMTNKYRATLKRLLKLLLAHYLCPPLFYI